MTAPLGVGVLGLGFMGRTHLAAWQRVAADGHACRVVAVCDRDESRRAGRTGGGGNLASGALLFDPSTLATYAEAEALFADDAVDLVSITTPTDTHVELALAALAAGKHVLVEKPVALASADVARLAEAARGSDLLVMPALCIRFWPGWSWLKHTIDAGSLGALRSLSLRRLSSRPDWNPAFYGDAARTGGALVDLHLHDADLVRWCLGDPAAVLLTGDLDHLTAVYRYASGPAHVMATAGWDHAPGFPFSMGYIAVFERGTAEYEFRRTPPLTVARDGELEEPALDPRTGYELEVAAFLDAIVAGEEHPPATLGEAWALARLLEAERESLGSGAWVAVGGTG